MNAMGHDVPNRLGVSQEGVAPAIQSQLPGYMAMGEKGMEEMTRMAGMEGPANTLPMMGGEGPFGAVGMGGMFTLLKVRDYLYRGRGPGLVSKPCGLDGGVDPSGRRAL